MARRSAATANAAVIREDLRSLDRTVDSAISEAAAAMGRKGGAARKAAGANYKKLGKAGGRAGKGGTKPRSPEDQRLTLARRLLRAARADGTLSAAGMARAVPGMPEMHGDFGLREAALSLGVAKELQAARREAADKASRKKGA